MRKKHYMKDTEQFWANRTKARIALDIERANAPVSEKLKIAEKLRRDALFLKTGRWALPKP